MSVEEEADSDDGNLYYSPRFYQGGEGERTFSRSASGVSDWYRIRMAPRTMLFHKRGAKPASHHRSRAETLKEQTSFDPLEVSVPTLRDKSGHGHDHSSGHSTLKSHRIRISPSGQCTAVNEDGSTSHGDDEAIKEIAVEQRKLSAQRLALGKLTGTLHDKVLDAYLWLMRQGKGKNIKADKEILSTYHDSFLYGEVPLTIKVRTSIRGWPLRNYLMWIEFFAAITSVVLYVVSTYHHNKQVHWERMVQLFCGLFFVVDYILNVYSAPVRLYYIFSANGLIDFVSTLPIVLFWSPGKSSGAAILLFFRVLRVMPVIAKVGALTGGAIKERIFVLVMYTIGVVFIAAGVLQWVDNKFTSADVRATKGCPDEGCLNFFQACYFMIVTVSTVGYGDITPVSNWGRAVAMCIIIGALVILPVQINKILQLASRRPYGGSFEVRKVVGSRFIIVSGNLSYRTVQDFLAEFYHPNHDTDMPAFPLRVVILAPFKPSFELKTLLMHYRDKVEFIEGTPVKDSDLDRVSAKVATAFYLLADQQAKDADAEDAAQIVRTLSVHRHCGSSVRVIVELLKPERAASAIWDDTEHGIEIMCLDVIRFKLLARSCHIRGLSTFIVNLFRSGLAVAKPLKGHRLAQYLHGLRQAIFPVILPDCFHEEGLSFEEAAEVVYRKYQIILFGLDIAHENMSGETYREVLLYPKGRMLHSNDVGLVIATDLNAAERISKFHGGGHHYCLGLRKFCCAACIRMGVMHTFPHKAEDRALLESVKMGKELDIEIDGMQINQEQTTAMEGVDDELKEFRDSLAEVPRDGRKGIQKPDHPASRIVSQSPLGADGGDHSVHRVHGLTSHASMTKGEKDWSHHGGHIAQELISHTSIGKAELEELKNHQRHGLNSQSSLGQNELQELQSGVPLAKNQNGEKLKTCDSLDAHVTPKPHTTLEDAINLAMSWPPAQQFDKPDPAILERRGTEILQSLHQRTMNVVKLHHAHILLCIQGKWPTSLFYFVSYMRTPGMPNPPIVILHPHEPSAIEWGCVGFFDHVYFVKGSPSYELDLVRAGVLQAEKVVILTQGSQKDQHSGEIANDEDRLAPTMSFTLDVNNVMIAATVERLLRPSKDRVIVELQQETEIQYLQPRLMIDRRIFDNEMYERNRAATFQFAPPYMDGKAFCPASLGFLMYATFYNRQTVAIVDQLVSGGHVLEMDDSTHSEQASDFLVRELDQIPIPKYYVGQSFESLFLGMLRDESALALGLYRETASNKAGLSYVYTNPIPTEVLEATDLVYILH